MISAFDLLVLSQVPGIGSNRLRLLVSHFSDTSILMRASPKEICLVEGFSQKLAAAFHSFIGSRDIEDAKRYAENQLSKLNNLGANILIYWDAGYPDSLKKIYDPPAFLFVRGKIKEEDKYSIAIVGTRSPSGYGSVIAEKFSQELARIGLTIVSGLARGIDTIAHSTAVKTNGRTIAVIGSGLDVIYPPENRLLSEKISGQGAVISEYEMGAKPDAVNFPRRNRIISGLSLGTIVIETDVSGGAMITANTALDQNREVFALPGNITSKRSRGCHALIKEGRAKLVDNVDDVLDELSYKLKPLLKPARIGEARPLPQLTLFEKSIIDILGAEPLHIDLIAEDLKMSASDVLVNLLSLEFKGLVKQLAGKKFVRL